MDDGECKVNHPILLPYFWLVNDSNLPSEPGHLYRVFPSENGDVP